jgi:hypothetical protein
MNKVNDDAWNNFVMNNDPTDYDVGTVKRRAAIACQFMGLSNNGGFNAFLTTCNYLDASEVLESLKFVGALKAAEQFGLVLDRLGVALPASSQEARWKTLERRWTDELDGLDVLSSPADAELLQALEKHVREYEGFYLKLN